MMLRCWRMVDGERQTCPDCRTVVQRRGCSGKCTAHGPERVNGHATAYELLRELGHVGPVYQEMPVHTLKKQLGKRESRDCQGRFKTGCSNKVDLLALHFGQASALAIEVCGDEHVNDQAQRERDLKKDASCHWPVCWLLNRHKPCEWKARLVAARDGGEWPSLTELQARLTQTETQTELHVG